MTTSYPLSLRLKELGVRQEGGEYYWRKIVSGNGVYLAHETNAPYSTRICRALTLGEVVRELVKFGDVNLDIYKAQLSEIMTYAKHNGNAAARTTPEEAAGELLAELKQKEG